MSVYEHLESFAGKRVVDFRFGGTLADPATTIPRLRLEYEDQRTATDLFGQLLEQPDVDRITGLVIGAWGQEMYEETPALIVEALVAAASQLPLLTALFLGDIISEENEISWIQQSDLSPLWAAYPRLQEFHVRGSNGLTLWELKHDQLKTLVIETGGLPVSVIREIDEAELPSLEHLELYLGTGNYGWDGGVEDLAAILAGERFPRLKYLGLRNSEITDDVAKAAADAPVLDRIEVLDLSLGTLSDEGAEALLASPRVRKLRKLDLHRHDSFAGMMQRLKQLPLEVDVSEPEDPDGDGSGGDDRYVAVSE